MFKLLFHFYIQFYYFSMIINGFLWNFTVFSKFYRKNTKENVGTCFVFVYIFYKSSIIWGPFWQHFLLSNTRECYFYSRNISMYNVDTTMVTSEKLKAFHWNFFLTFSTRITIVKLVLWKKFYIIKRGNRVTTMVFYFCFKKIHFIRVLLCGKNWTYFVRL